MSQLTRKQVLDLLEGVVEESNKAMALNSEQPLLVARPQGGFDLTEKGQIFVDFLDDKLSQIAASYPFVYNNLSDESKVKAGMSVRRLCEYNHETFDLINIADDLVNEEDPGAFTVKVCSYMINRKVVGLTHTEYFKEFSKNFAPIILGDDPLASEAANRIKELKEAERKIMSEVFQTFGFDPYQAVGSNENGLKAILRDHRNELVSGNYVAVDKGEYIFTVAEGIDTSSFPTVAGELKVSYQ